ncbi:TPA: ThiF family adenylyltransferase, partial [Enterococcus faecalis]|nr:ThiF family adenylyltransferase [Enterococcus faecalis]
YILKMLASKGLKKITMVDNDVVETGNLFRYAFPYIGVPKVDAAESFVNAVNSDAVIIKINRVGLIQNLKVTA